MLSHLPLQVTLPVSLSEQQYLYPPLHSCTPHLTTLTPIRRPPLLPTPQPCFSSLESNSVHFQNDHNCNITSVKKLSAEMILEIMRDYKNIANPSCPLCGRGYSTMGNLKQHLHNVHLQHETRSVCSLCGKSYKSKQYLITHLSQVHNLRKRFN